MAHDHDHAHLAPGDDPVTDGTIWEDPHHEHDGGHGHDDHHVHVIPFWPMFNVFIILIVLTVLTIWTAGWPVGEFLHLMLALVIATVKSVLVCMYFMHLKYDKPLNTIVLVSTVFGVVLFIGLTALDIGNRGWDDRRQRGEIHEGGRLELHAGTLPSFDGQPTSEPRPKAAMNIVELARQHAEQMAGNESLGKQPSNSSEAAGPEDGAVPADGEGAGVTEQPGT